MGINLGSKSVLVTGADGFIGSHLVEALAAEGSDVHALAYYNSFNDWGWLETVDCKDRIDILTGDVRDPHYCEQITKKVDIVFHLAAIIAIPYSYIAPDSYVDTNVKGTLNICQAALENGCERIIHTSTSEVYGSARYVPIDEKHPLQPQSPYSASKVGADAIALSFYRSFDLPVTIVRPFNNYGPRQSARAVIPAIVTQIAAGKKMIKLGALSPTRDFIFVKDTCRGFISVLKTDDTIGEVLNIGSNMEISIGDTFNLIREIMGADVEAVKDSRRIRPDRSEVLRLCCDYSKIKSLTGFEPAVTFRQGLEETIHWFEEERNLRRYKLDIYNV
jgi:NAD dependent epimerase/dehydratase